MAKTVLLIDDDAFTRRLLKKQIVKEGCEVHEAANGEEGLHKFLEIGPDLVFCDRVMPGMSGFDVLERLRAMQVRQVPFVFLTALTDTRDKHAVSHLDAADYLEKPVTAEILRACLQKFLK